MSDKLQIPHEMHVMMTIRGATMLARTIIEYILVCLMRFFTSQSTIFQLCRDGSSSVESKLCKD